MAPDWLHGIDNTQILIKTITMNKRFLITSLVSVALAFAGYAEEKTHVVERGETLTTIAKTYGVTEQALIKANPDAASFCYVGMVLNIPETADAQGDARNEAVSSVKDSARQEMPVNDNQTSTVSKPDNKVVHVADEEDDEKGAKNFSSLTLSYMAGYKDFEHGMYGLMVRGFYGKGLGMVTCVNANYGLAPRGCRGGMAFEIGPTYGYAFTKFFMLHVDLLGNVGWTDIKAAKDMVVTGGIEGGPGVLFKFGNGMIGATFLFGWSHSPSYKLEGVGEVKASDSFTKGIRLSFGWHI